MTDLRRRYLSILNRAVVVLCFFANLSFGAHAGESVEFRFGIVNERMDEPGFALTQYSPLRNYLQTRLQPSGIEVVSLVIARDIPDMTKLIAAKEVDAVIEGVFPTLIMQQSSGMLQHSLLVWRKGQRQYYTVFFSHKQGAIRSFEDLPGRILVFEAPRSTSAYAAPKAFLQQRGFHLIPMDQADDDDKAIRYVFSGAEINQAYWVLHGKGDAAAFNDGDWERLAPGIREKLHIFARTPPILRWLVSFRRGIEPDTQAAVENALLQMHENSTGREALLAASNIKRFERLAKDDIDRLAVWRDILLIENP